MFRSIKVISLVAGLSLAGVAMAQTPAAAPAGSTGMCRDGSYWSGATKKGACHGHKGVQDWYAGAASTTASAPPSAPAAPVAAVAATASTSATNVAPVAPVQASKAVAAMAPAPGGGAGQVWVNASSKVYHCPADRYYGKTKNGSYMSEADALAKGNHADHGKACK